MNCLHVFLNKVVVVECFITFSTSYCNTSRVVGVKIHMFEFVFRSKKRSSSTLITIHLLIILLSWRCRRRNLRGHFFLNLCLFFLCIYLLNLFNTARNFTIRRAEESTIYDVFISSFLQTYNLPTLGSFDFIWSTHFMSKSKSFTFTINLKDCMNFLND